MSDFMESEFVQEGLDKIQRLQEEIFADMMRYDNFDADDKLQHLEKLGELVDAQSSMYMRMSLSDDPAAIERKEAIQEFCKLMGFAHGSDVQSVFSEMRETIQEMKESLDT
jgi:hypothetical protein